jgi:hypothetical protein
MTKKRSLRMIFKYRSKKNKPRRRFQLRVMLIPAAMKKILKKKLLSRRRLRIRNLRRNSRKSKRSLVRY